MDATTGKPFKIRSSLGISGKRHGLLKYHPEEGQFAILSNAFCSHGFSMFVPSDARTMSKPYGFLRPERPLHTIYIIDINTLIRK